MKVIDTGKEYIYLLSLDEIADELGLSRRTISRYASEGRFPTTRIGRKKYVTRENLALYLRGAESSHKWEKVPPLTYDGQRQPMAKTGR